MKNLTTVIIGNSVTSIGKYAFSGCSSLTSIAIPNSVTYIRSSAFSGCTGLTSVTIGNSVTGIGEDAFSGCIGLTSITIPNSVTYIGSSAFSGCTGLTSITIPNRVTNIGDYAFNGCTSLTSVTIPNSVTSIGEYTFYGCTGLTSVIISNSVTSIGWFTFSGCTGLTSVTIPNSVTSIGYRAFYGCTSLTSVTIPNSVTSIGSDAFYGCTSLTSITIPNSVTSIGDDVFRNCRNLTFVSVGMGMEHLSASAFGGCGALTKVVWNAKACGDIYNAPFQYQSISTFTFGDSVKYIPQNLCKGCSGLTSIAIPNGVTSIGSSAFSGCSGLTSVTIPNSVTSIECGAFFGCTSLTSVTIPHSVTSIGKDAFSGCSGLTSVTIPNSVTSIGDYAFYGCTGLASAIISNSVTSMGKYAFGGCRGLTSITSLAVTPPNANSSAFEYVPTDVPIYIPCGTKADYSKAAVWNQFTNYVEPDAEYKLIVVSDSIKGVAAVTQTNTCNNDTAIIVAEAGEHYRFVQWNDGNNDNPRRVVVTRDTAFTAEFVLLNYSIITTCNPQHGQVTGSGTYAYGTEISLMATPAENYQFTQWSDGNKDNPRKVTVTADATYTAEFALQNYAVTATCDPQHGQVTGGGTYPYGSEVTLTATPNTGYAFTQWSDGNKDNPRKVTITVDATYTAEFALQNYVVTATCDPQQGQVTGGGTYSHGSEATLTATPNKGYAFTQWSDGNKDNPRKVTVTADATYTAEFALQNYVVTATCDPQHGEVTGGGTYPYGSEVTLMATPNTGYAFTQWSDGNKDNPRKVTVTTDATYTAEFALQNYVVSATCDPQHGQVTGGGTYPYGSEVTLTAVPNDGYTFKQWSDGTIANPYSFSVEKDVNIEAWFEPTTLVENVAAEENAAPRKVFRDGQVYILRGGKTYTLTGEEVK